ncbi:MAG: aromatic hydrocarbon degradation membrane protein [Desulfobulbaceae bacterium BRH_c16a]|nr:MAG: aromatic hydrocarbon degradation membrane protein [Desulfobulbaceae bacterium BRH_c16a]
MKKTISVLALASIFTAGSAMASGWRIPEQSVDSTAKAGANIASSKRGDTAYFNPANMAWMADTWHVEFDATYIYLAPIEYEDSRTSAFDGESETEHFLLPELFLVSPSFGGARFGVAVVEPFGLSKRWKDPYQKAFAEEFSLAVIEVNPTVSYSFADMVSISAGPRMLYADATVKTDASGLGLPLSREMEGDTVEWGWNAAVAVKPMEKLNISATYRSNVDLEFEDKAKLNLMGTRVTLDADVSIPAPAVLAFSVAYDVLDNLNVELTWDRTFWSEYETLDFNFSPVIPGNPFEAPQARDWDDTDAFRIGVTYGVNQNLDVMLGFGYDQNGAPTEHIGFELPDSDAWLYSIGAQYKMADNMDIGIAMLYDYKESRTVEVNPTDRVYGEFTNASALLVTVGLNYRF